MAARATHRAVNGDQGIEKQLPSQLDTLGRNRKFRCGCVFWKRLEYPLTISKQLGVIARCLCQCGLHYHARGNDSCNL
jgi:hypothetical protein